VATRADSITISTSFITRLLAPRLNALTSGGLLLAQTRLYIGSAVVFDLPDLPTYSTAIGRRLFIAQLHAGLGQPHEVHRVWFRPVLRASPMFAPVRQIR
jgi:hypothetical protein